jgi:uncharacterized membrane protein YfcA
VDLTVAAWLLLAAAAASIGFSKTAIGGVGQIGVVIFAAVLPARESTGALLPLLLVGDVTAVAIYRRHVDWPALRRLLPLVAVGVVLGVAFVAVADDTLMRRAIGVILLVLVGFHLVQRRLAPRSLSAGAGDVARPLSRPDPATAGFGLLAGFTTMVANSGGPPTSLYLLRRGLSVDLFIGTMAWFFLIVNLAKVPFSVGLGLITGPSLLMNLVLAPTVVIGAWLGRLVIVRVRQDVFERLVLLLVAVSAVLLLFG